MRLSTRAEYACLAAIELACRYDSGLPVSLKTISDLHGISSKYLVQIMIQLKAAGLVQSARGSSGGFQLARPPEEINLLEILTAIDGPWPDQHKLAAPSQTPTAQALASALSQLLALERDFLQDISLAELAHRAQKPVADMYFI
ncbi:MAG: Rrf2 family transcriptional regulator [Gemmatales bacterium]|nr:Rrf2 family transcriptional regulator [Gemmatales bacterium]MDW8223165.1 Rrf2 family transcriptional regulator [Gemmatales bacterium]